MELISYEKEFIRESLDDKLFVPLSEFFLNNDPNPEDLEELISTKGHPNYHNPKRPAEKQSTYIDHYRGFVLDIYVKMCLSKFSKITDSFSLSQFTSGSLPNGYIFESNNWENIFFHNPINRNTVTELDALYEFYENSSIIPIIFEITFRSSKKERSRLKRELVEQIYGFPAYYCRVRPTKKNEELGVYKRDEYSRQIFFPYQPIVDDMASKLWEMDRKK